MRVSDVGEAVDSVEDIRNAGYANGKPSVLVIIFRQPGANIIDTVDRIRADAAAVEGGHSAGHQHAGGHGSDRHHPRFGARRGTIAVISVVLVILVVFVFLRNVAHAPSFPASRCRSR